MKIPPNYIKFLHWFKSQTEQYWQNIKAIDEDEYWLKNAKWIGLDFETIDKIEQQYNISFSPQHKAFLNILHTTDKKRQFEYYDGKDDLYITVEKSLCYNWLEDKKMILEYLERPYRDILRDVKKSYWLKSWGKRLESISEIEKIFSDWYENAPKLIPIYGHRSVVNTGTDESPVLSVCGSDTIVYGWNMQDYLLHEFGYKIPSLHKMVYDEEDKMYYSEYIQEFEDFNTKAQARGRAKGIPFWYELIKTSSPNHYK